LSTSKKIIPAPGTGTCIMRCRTMKTDSLPSLPAPSKYGQFQIPLAGTTATAELKSFCVDFIICLENYRWGGGGWLFSHDLGAAKLTQTKIIAYRYILAETIPHGVITCRSLFELIRSMRGIKLSQESGFF